MPANIQEVRNRLSAKLMHKLQEQGETSGDRIFDCEEYGVLMLRDCHLAWSPIWYTSAVLKKLPREDIEQAAEEVRRER